MLLYQIMIAIENCNFKIIIDTTDNTSNWTLCIHHNVLLNITGKISINGIFLDKIKTCLFNKIMCLHGFYVIKLNQRIFRS